MRKLEPKVMMMLIGGLLMIFIGVFLIPWPEGYGEEPTPSPTVSINEETEPSPTPTLEITDEKQEKDA